MLKKMTLLAALLTLGSATAQTTFTVIRPDQWGAQNMNPFSPEDQHLQATNSAIYESLFYVNALSGKVTPVLGTAYKWSADNKTLTVTTRSGVKWSDGTPFTARDAAFTFNYIKQYPALDIGGVWKNGLAGARATSDTTLVLTFGRVFTPIFPYIAGVMIVPEHLWSKVTSPMTEPNAKPVGTGPFVFDSYSQQAVRVLKNPNYWMKGQPYVGAVVWLSTSSNDAALLKLLKGEADYGYLGLTDPLGGYVNRGPNYQIFWPTTNANYLYFNTAKAPFNDRALRWGMAQAINPADVAQKAYAGAIKAADPSGIIPGQQAAWKPGNLPTLKYDPAAADRALTAAGYKKDAQGNRLGKDGQPLPTFKILVGAGWTDFITMAQVVSGDLNKVRIKTQIDQQAWSGYAGSVQTGNYDLAISWGWASGSTPFYLYNASFAPENSAPLGKTAASNISRYTNPQITAALRAFAATTDPATQKKAIATISRQFVQDLPFFAFTARSNFSVYNTSKFTNFPTAQNPYAAGTPDDNIGARLMFLNVKPR